MKKTIILSASLIMLVSIVSGFALSRSLQRMTLKIHTKDVPAEGLILVRPSDPSFEVKFAKQMEGQSSNIADRIRPFSVFLENRSKQTVVAYMIQWCFTRRDGTNDCYKDAFVAPRALMEGGNIADGGEALTGKIKPGSAQFVSLISPDGTGLFRVPISPDEAERMKQGSMLDRNEILERSNLELAKYTDVTVALDGAFFSDGTFVGDDTSGFFDQINAQVQAKRDLLNELAVASANNSKDKVYAYIETVANQPAASIGPKSTSADHYSYYRKFYAKQIISSCRVLGNERGIAMALDPSKKPWRVLAKKQDKTR